MPSKSELRTEARTRRAELARALPDFARRIAAFAERLNIPANAIVAGYWPVRDEADPRALMKALAARDAKLALPRVDAKGDALSFRAWREDDELVDNHHGIAEPRADAKIVTPDVVLIPLLAFDARGHRLGYGGGYYDRTLDRLRYSGRVLAVGVAFTAQLSQEIPRESHDQVLDLIITENGILAVTPGGIVGNAK